MATLLDKYYNVRIKLRNDSHSNWKIQEEKGFRPYDGEIIIYDILGETEAAQLNMPPVPFQMLKIGDGVHTLKELPFVNDLSSHITTGKDKGAISVLGEDIYVKGLTPDQHNVIMAFQPIKNFYSKIEADNLMATERAVREAAEALLQENINKEAKTRQEADAALNQKIQDTQKNIEENIEVKLTEVREDFYDFKEETEEALQQAVTNGTVTLENPSSLVYNLKQGGQTVGTINIPKDLFVKSGKIVTNPTGLAAGTYIELVLQNQNNPIYINVGTLIDIYTHQQKAAQVQVNVDNNTRIISATIVPGSITSAEIKQGSISYDRLSKQVQTILDTAENQLSGGEGSVSERFEQLKKYIDNQLSELFVDEILFNCMDIDEE